MSELISLENNVGKFVVCTLKLRKYMDIYKNLDVGLIVFS